MAPPVALGDADTIGTLMIPEDSSLASILPSLYVPSKGGQAIAIRRLDTLVERPEIPAPAKIAIKIDVQGYEDKVLDGAEATLRRAIVVLIEVSLVPTYVGEQDYLKILGRLADCGFRAVYFSPVISRKIYGECYQTDVLLVRR